MTMLGYSDMDMNIPELKCKCQTSLNLLNEHVLALFGQKSDKVIWNCESRIFSGHS